MKKIYILLIAAISLSVNAFSINYVSNASGAWSTPTIWTPNGTPTSLDNVTISAGHTITSNVDCFCLDLTINGTLTGQTLMRLLLRGNYTVAAGGTENGIGGIYFNTGSAAVITNNGTIGAGTSYLFYKNMTIASGNSITKTVTINIQGGITVTNQSSVTLGAATVAAGSTWVNAAGSTLTLTKGGFLTSPATAVLVADASGNTIHYSYTDGATTIKTPSAGYYNLTVSGVSPKILSSDLIVLNNVTINTGSQLAVNGFNLTVGGNFLKNGNFVTNAGKTVTFNGSVAQTISGTGTTTFRGLAVDNAMGVSISSGTYILDEVLTVSNGTFNTGGFSFTMTSTATKTARIAPITGSGAIAGNFNIQRFITARDTTWADFSSPVQSSTFADWDNELPAISYTSTPGFEEPSASTYSETADAYVPVTTSATPLNAGQGFEVFLSGDFSYASLPATTMTTIGVPNQGDFDLSSAVSNTVQGWNLVGNPFASSISWASIYTASGGASSGMYDFIEMYDYTIQDWAGYTSADGIEIGATQGFWVYGLSGPMTLLIPESSKTTSSNSSIKASSIVQPYFTLKMASATSSAAHIFKVVATEEALDGLDGKDIPFRPSLNKATPQMYCMLDGKKININNFNLSNDSYSIPLKTKAAVSGNYKMEAAGFDFVADYTCITLQDNLTGKMIDLKDGNGYSFTMNASDNIDRFILHFSKDNNCKTLAAATISPNSDFENQIEILPSAQGNTINFNLSETTNTNISIVNVLGQTLVESISLDANTQSVNIALPEGHSGMYIIKVESAKGSITKKFVRK